MTEQVGKILITGGNGFIGRALAQKLNKNGYEVITFDIGDGDIAEGLPDYKDVQHVFHLAAATFVPKSWELPKEFYRTNIMGTVNVMDFCCRYGCSFTLPSTYMYGAPQYLPIDENHPLQTDISPYHSSKGAAEQIAQFYAKNMRVSGVILRMFNVYGYGQGKNFLIPSILEKVVSPDTQEVSVADLEPKRDFVFIDDVIQALIISMKQPSGTFDVYNVGYGKSWSVSEVIETIEDVFGIRKPYSAKGIRRPGEIMDTVADISKIQANLGWTPRYDLRQGILKIREQMGS
jgi:nucleoside-diphosphate-sugar epimerase